MSVASNMDSRLRKVAVIGNYVPRRCGIATFTSDLLESMAAEAPETTFWAVVMNDVPGGYRYPHHVRFEIADTKLTDYRLAADFLNMNQVDVVCLQHEYGIFGGTAGRYILRLIGDLRMPVVTTLHTVLRNPSPPEREVMNELVRFSDRLVVMSAKAAELLQEVHGAPAEKITLIHHGIPDVPFVDPNYHKDQFGVEGKKVILTFGLLSPGKGIEHMIRALPAVVEKHPDTVYIVLGVTHPNIKRTEGEAYRLRLQQLAKNLGVGANIIFQNRFVDIQELTEFLGAADIYVTPYVAEAQIVSGTLAYAMGSGKAIVSTPYWYAAEMLAENRGRLVPFADPEALAGEVLDLLENPTERHAMRKRSYLYMRDAVWAEVARRYLRVFEEARAARAVQPGTPFTFRPLVATLSDLPDINLEHLRRLTDDTGIVQHATFNVPDRRHGYCTDDNARALLFTALAEETLPPESGLAELRSRYLSFLHHAFSEETGRFRNFLSYDKRWLEDQGSEDSHARALWALGVTTRSVPDQGHLSMAAVLFNRAVTAAEHFVHPRAWAFSLVGIDAYLEKFVGDSEAKRVSEHLAERLLHEFALHGTPDWPWPEDVLTYDNAKLPHALLAAGRILRRDDMVHTGLRSLEWLVALQTENGRFSPVGNRGWYARGGPKARFDQQPLEAQALIDACIAAHGLTGEEKWVDVATLAFHWFLGQNDLNLSMCDLGTGGCYDGLQADGPNLNQGAESTLAWLIALAEMYRLRAGLSMRGLTKAEMTTPSETAQVSRV
ncbi:MAG: glycosyltransferase family 4 protein [Thermoleophilia bacterium]